MASLPEYVTGTARTGLPVGHLSTNVTVYAPVGAPLQALRLGRRVRRPAPPPPCPAATCRWSPRRLAPGATETYRFTVPVRDGAVTVWTTPTLTSPGFVTATC